MLFSSLSVVAISTTAFAAETNPTEESVSEDASLFKGMEGSLRALADYYYTDSNGRITLDYNNPDLKGKLGFNTLQINYLKSMIEESTSSDITVRGQVGFHLKFGPYIKGLGATGAAAFAAGYLTAYLSELAATGPLGVAAVAALDAMVAYVVFNAINDGLNSVNLMTNIPGLSWTMNVNIP